MLLEKTSTSLMMEN